MASYLSSVKTLLTRLNEEPLSKSKNAITRGVYPPPKYKVGQSVEITTAHRSLPFFVHCKGKRGKIVEIYKNFDCPYRINGLAPLFHEDELIPLSDIEEEKPIESIADFFEHLNNTVANDDDATGAEPVTVTIPTNVSVVPRTVPFLPATVTVSKVDYYKLIEG